MPWKSSEAPAHTKAAKTPKQKRAWRDIANKSLAEGRSDASAIRIANAAIKHVGKKRKK